ncbi:two-component system nitrogen regulation sensor histidine kinase NtrY [Bradyrhizobium sp. USDA 4518]|uniref:sensor histidine kinase NtrY-like n=1 Tax=Bradyrhizobium TaxID=374 RepID=UPI001E4B9C8C|nr:MULTISPECIES: ATP-binding protein [Bradyrhizobium]MCC8948836.1 PAS domain S-box protein [Bradyrhizobium brasilense]MCP1833055.1 two-component system nitrogen regulation sensor histidine kinase NtrY [Bradyrhizobium sp. USDA 4545]MCP1851939.1 two-component system nitrogen regulation sensor histidine kinase NtrY [Bradyrhizobium sp. USDA 4541]MCP1917800.1 two-component system nitrogen regulation sensor histidine kinase NtrY [Bradyrhizobium sp. USDA 4532]
MTSAETTASTLRAPSAEPNAEARGFPLRRWLAPFAVAIALLSAFLTFVVLTGLTPIEPTSEVVRSFLMINAGTILLLVGIIVREVWQMVQARRRGRAAARLHVQIVGLFSVIAVLPAVLVSIVANVTIERGLDRLFSGPTKQVIQNSLTIASAYMQEHAQLINGDTLAMANDLAHARPLYDQDRMTFLQLMTAGAESRNLPVAVLMDKDGKIVASAETGVRLNYEAPPPDILKDINETEPKISVFPENYVASVVRLRAYDDMFLYVARLLDPAVVAQLKQTQTSAAEYAQLETRRLGIQVAFALMFAVIALTILMASVLIGLNFANGLVSPIRQLMGAASEVSTGNLNVQVPVNKSESDLALLGEIFNKMTQELRTQRNELVDASETIDSRRRFIEAVLSSASAGIIGVDASGTIGVLNRSAEKLIGHAESETLGHPLSDVLPELDEMMKTAREGTQRLVQGQVTILRDGHERNLSVRVSAEQTSQSRDSYIITLDDITELVSAQRTSAWGDVARRIAHEIKNPLTPIQLSAERIRRKFGKTITEEKDKSIFEQCTDTIVRQVDDIRRMVDEFSRFARMPKPVMEGEDVADVVRQAVFLMKVAHPDLDIEADIKQSPLPAQFDRRLISQALTNIIKNATEAIEQVPREELGKGRIDVVAQRENDDILIDVVDNGIGLPKVARARLLEPYVTTRAKGTGLGLAIVGRVLEDHGGRIELKDASDFRDGQRGAWMRLRFAVTGHAAKPENKPESKDQKPDVKPDKAEPESEKNPPEEPTNGPAQATNNEPKIQEPTQEPIQEPIRDPADQGPNNQEPNAQKPKFKAATSD